MSEFKVIIRPMQDSDMPFIHEGLAETNWQDIPACQKQFVEREDVDKRVIDDFDTFLKAERYKFKVFVAECAGTPVGYISFGELTNHLIGLPIGSLLDLWVAPEHRKQGIGDQLFDHALKELDALGYTQLGGMASATNKASLHMCEKRGFVQGHIGLYKQVDPKSE